MPLTQETHTLRDSRERPLVSVVVCVYNAGSYFRSSLQSVLDQTYPNLEILVIDDGSTDGCLDTARDLLADPRVRLFSQPNSGKPVALNRALEELRGEFYMIHDADDLSHPERVSRLVERFRQNPDLGAVMSGHQLLIGDRTLAPTFQAKSPEVCKRFIDDFKQPAHDPTAMYRVSNVRGMDYDTDLPVVEGYDYVLRAGERFPMEVVGAALYSYRIHPHSVTKATKRAEMERRVRRVAEKAAQRRNVPIPPQFQPPPSGAPPKKLRNQDLDNNLAAHFMDSAVQLCGAGRRGEAIRNSLYCASLHPLDVHYLKALVYCFLPLSLVQRVRKTVP